MSYSVSGQSFNITKPKTKKKKAPRNAFSFYLDDAMKELRRNGTPVSNKSEAVPLVHDKWKNMPSEQKAIYEQKAKDWKMKNKQQPRPGRLDCTGHLIDNRINMDDHTDQERKRARKHCRELWNNKHDVCDFHFYIISFQSLFEFPSEEGYQPCEVACIDFTLRQGIVRVWHQFIDPGPIKLGLRAEVKFFREKTHQIPEENFEYASGDYHTIWQDLLNFINPNRDSRVFPPIFSKMSEMKKTSFCLDWLSARAGICNQLVKQYEIEDTAADLFNFGGLMRPALSVVEDGCSSHMYDYESNTSCDYHNQRECIYCAVLTVKKCCYWMSDSLANVFEYEITDQHLPVRQPANYVVTRPEQYALDYDHRPNSRNWRTSNPLSSASRGGGLEREEFQDRYDERSGFESRDIGFGSRDIRYRGQYDIVPAHNDCTWNNDAASVASTESESFSTASSNINPYSLGASGSRTPSGAGASRRPFTNPRFAQKASGTLAANFSLRPTPPQSAESSEVGSQCGDIDRLSEDFQGQANIAPPTSSGDYQRSTVPKHLLGRGRGRGNFYKY